MKTRRAFFVAYVTTVIAAGVALLSATWLPSGFPIMTQGFDRFAFWLFLSLAAECFWMDTSSREGMISMSLAVNVATLFILPLPQVLMIAAISVTTSDLLFHRRDCVRAYFNGGQTMLAMWTALLSMRAISGVDLASGRSFILEHPVGTLVGVAVFFFVNTGLVAGVISLNGGIRFVRAWRENFGFGYNLYSSAVLSLLGLTLVLASESIGYVVGVVYLVFLLFVRDAYHRFARSRASRMATGS